MKKCKSKLALIFILVGALLLAAAGGLYFRQKAVDRQAGKSIAALLKEYDKALSAADIAESDTTVLVNGKAMYGKLIIEELKLELPVYDTFENGILKSAPGRYYGTQEENNLVIAGYNYTDHFGELKLLQVEDEIRFIDVHGTEHLYTVSTVYHIEKNNVGNMKWSDYDLTLFTSNRTGDARLAVRCERVTEESLLDALVKQDQTE